MNYVQLICTILCAVIAIVPAMMQRRDGRKDKQAEAKRTADADARKKEFDAIKAMIEDFRADYASSQESNAEMHQAIIDENRRYQEENARMHNEIESRLIENSKRIDILDQCNMTILRVDIFQYYQFVMSRKDENGQCYLTPSDEENIEAVYKCYKQLGGNGVGEKYYHTMMALPTRR